MSRPTTFTAALGDDICALLAEGQSLRQICAMEGMPEKSTVLLWVVKGDRGEEAYKAFSDQYRRAREAQCEALLDEVIDIADGDEDVQRDKLKIETRFRAAAKMHPRKYGEKVQQELTGKDGTPLIPVTKEQRDAAVAAALAADS